MNRTEEVKAAYLQGYIDGLSAFAHWKDGIEYVGTCGSTLKKAIEHANSDPNLFVGLYRTQRERMVK